MVELADSLDSGSSVRKARAGSNPAFRTKAPKVFTKGAIFIKPHIFTHISFAHTLFRFCIFIIIGFCEYIIKNFGCFNIHTGKNVLINIGCSFNASVAKSL